MIPARFTVREDRALIQRVIATRRRLCIGEGFTVHPRELPPVAEGGK